MALNDEFYMDLALSLAEGTRGQTGINPAVACVLVRDGVIVGLGAHLERGKAHAEVHALQMAGELANGATAYVTLEPCSHKGRTGPCCEALVHAGVARVVIACADPNPLVAGRGEQHLNEHGVQVTGGILRERAEQLNQVFFKYIRTGLPFVAVKTASTLDGRLAAHTGDSRWVSGEEARQYVHHLRTRYMGLMVGIETVLTDDPELTARNPVPSLQPWKIVVDSRLRLPLTARLLQQQPERTIILTTNSASDSARRALEALGVRVFACGEGARVDLTSALRQLGRAEISSILLEGGGTLNGAMLEANLIDKAYLFVSPKIIGGGAGMINFQFPGISAMKDAITLKQHTVQQMGADILITGYFN